MTKDEFIALGLTDELAAKAAAASAEELKAFVPKARFDEVNDAKKQAEKGITDRDKQIEELGKTVGASEELKKQIDSLMAENKAAKDKYESDLKELKLNNAIKSALNGKAHDEALVAGLFDKSKLVIDGDNIVGLDEQMKALQETKGFLFKQEEKEPPKTHGFKVGGDGGNSNPPATSLTLKEAIAAHFQK